MSNRVRLRSFVIGILMTLLFVAIIFRLYVIQVVEAEQLQTKAERAWATDKTLLAKRGSILDRNNKILAWDAPSYTVAVNPKLIHDKNLSESVIEGLSELLDMTEPSKLEKLKKLVNSKKKDGTYYVQREIRNEGWKIDAEVAEKIKQWIKKDNIKGIYLMPERKRYYPFNQLAAQVLGYVQKDGTPAYGTEKFYDELLHGKDGRISYEHDRLGYELPDAKVTYDEPQDGKTLKLTIDHNIQHFMESAMEKTYAKFKPKSMVAVAVDPQTMEILGLANYPNFNPNQYWASTDQGNFFNHVVSSQYEPGSTFKIVTLAGAVQEGIFNPNDTYKSGSIRVPGGVIRDHNNGEGWGTISFLDGLKRSSNVAFVKLGYEGLGGEKLMEYIKQFGFGQKTGVDLPGELAGLVNFNLNYATEVATATFGQGRVAVTPIQQVAAVAAVANGGKLMVPHLVKEVIDTETGEVVEKIEPKVVRQVISESTANQVKEYLETVVSDQEIGTGRRVFIDGYRIAGKSGTAQKVIDGKYADGEYIISFIGFAPVENPKILLLVIVDQPDIGGDYRLGGTVTAPMFREIMYNSLRYLNIPSFHAGEKKEKVVVDVKDAAKAPELKGLSLKSAESHLQKNHFSYTVLGSGKQIVDQYPEIGTQMSMNQRMYLLTEPLDKLALPDMTGWSLRDVLEVTTMLGYQCSFSGEGYVSEQAISVVNGSKRVVIKLKPLRELTTSVESGENSTNGNP